MLPRFSHHRKSDGGLSTGVARLWAGWPIERAIYLFVGVVFLAVFVQVTLYHWRQNFRHWSMWIPVIATPALGLVALLLAWQNMPWLRALLGLLSAAGIVSGLAGTYFHVAGVGERVDGYNLNNFMVGPPPALPVLVSALSVLALMGLYLA